MDLKGAVATELEQQLNISAKDLEVPREPKLGDYALPCYPLSKEWQKAPHDIAKELAAKVKASDLIERATATGPYLNLFLKRATVIGKVLQEVLTKGATYGAACTAREKVLIEYSQPNSHKAFHVGHLRGTSIGEALSRILRHAGKDIVQANYSGDTGMHVAKWLWCYRQFHKGEEPPREFGKLGKWLAAIYVEAIRRLEENPELQTEVDRINLALDKREDKELLALWEKTKEWSVEEFNQIYHDLDAHFDVWWWESDLDGEAKQVADDLVSKGIAKESDGATIVDLEDEGLGVWVLLRKDGTPLYSAKDIALAQRKFQEYKVARSIYVVGAAQSLHMHQLFSVLEKMGHPQVASCFHLSYNEVRLPEGKMSSRTGKNIVYNDLRDQVFAVAEEGVRDRHPDWDETAVAESVHAIALCAMKFEMLYRDHNKSIVFDVKQVCDFEGDTGPYIQYTHARCRSILKKLGKQPDLASVNPTLLSTDAEYELCKLLNQFPEAVDTVSRHFEPGILATYALKLAKEFSRYYHESRVVGEPSELENARALLVQAAGLVLERSLTLLALPAPEQM